MRKREKKEKNRAYLSSIFAILVGLLVGFIILLIADPSQAINGFGKILTGAITDGGQGLSVKGIGQVLYYATPIMLTGLSVGFAFKTGLFNIGASGQFIVGAFGAVVVGIKLEQLGSVHWIVAMLAAALFGAIWAIIPGVLKALCNVNEVISCIMMNYIGMYFVNFAIKNDTLLFNQLKNESNPVAKTAQIPKFGLDQLFEGSSVGGGFIVAILVVILIYIVLNKTTFGYELKAVGFNQEASKYAGINQTRSIILSMAIAGALAGLAGGLLYLAGSGKYIEVVDILADEGFQGISVALLGLSNPVGILFSSLFISYISQGGFYLQMVGYTPEVIDIIIAVIIYFSAFALILQSMYAGFKKRRANVKRVPGTPGKLSEQTIEVPTEELEELKEQQKQESEENKEGDE